MRCEVEVNLRCLFEIVPVQMRDILLKNGSPGLLYPRYRCSTSSSHPLFFLAWWQLQTPIPQWIVRGSPPQHTDVCYRESLKLRVPTIQLPWSAVVVQNWPEATPPYMNIYKLYPISKLYEACIASSKKVCNTWKRSVKDRTLDPEHPSQNYSGLSQVPESQSMS